MEDNKSRFLFYFVCNHVQVSNQVYPIEKLGYVKEIMMNPKTKLFCNQCHTTKLVVDVRMSPNGKKDMKWIAEILN